MGTYVSFFIFGGQYPGESFIPRLYIVHVLLIPGLILALVTAHLMIIWHQGHTQWPGKKQRDNNEVGNPLYPVFMAKTGSLFFFTFGVLAVLATVAQINPIWLYGPYSPVNVSSLSQPDWYIGFLEGTLRMMPGVESNLAGHTFVWNVFLPAVALPVAFFLVMGCYPFFEQWATGDRRYHLVLDRPRNVPSRTGIGVAIMAMAADIQLAGADDVIGYHLNIPVEYLVWFFRVGFFVLPGPGLPGDQAHLPGLAARRPAQAPRRNLLRHRAAGGTGLHRREPAAVRQRACRPRGPAARAAPQAHSPPPDPAAHSRPGAAQLRARLNHFYVDPPGDPRVAGAARRPAGGRPAGGRARAGPG